MMIYEPTQWLPKRIAILDVLGFIPDFIQDSAAPIIPQLHAGYAHGGGWRPMSGWEIFPSGAIKYPGDPAIAPWVIGTSSITEEKIYIYPSAWVRVGDQIARMD